VKPLVVQILTKETRVSADKNYDVECRTSGSRPEAVITWWKANKPIKKMSQTVSVPCMCVCVCVYKYRALKRRYRSPLSHPLRVQTLELVLSRN